MAGTLDDIIRRGGVLGRIHTCGKLLHLACACTAAPDLRTRIAEQKRAAAAERAELVARQQEWENRYAPTLFEP